MGGDVPGRAGQLRRGAHRAAGLQRAPGSLRPRWCEGNDYGGALESYLTAPLLLVTSGTVALKMVPIALSFVAGLVLTWACVPLLGRRVALVVGAVSWVSSGAAVVLWSISYMGYASGAIALVGAIGCAVRLMTRPDPGLAFGAGLGVGVALWGHPIFGVVAALGCLPVLGVIWRRPLSILTAAAGGFLGALPWLLYLYGHGAPRIAQSRPPRDVPRAGADHPRGAVAQRLQGSGRPTARGSSRSPSQRVVAAVLVVGALVGLVVLTFRVGRAALPFTVAGLGAVPALAAVPGAFRSAPTAATRSRSCRPSWSGCSAGPGSVGDGNAHRMALAAAVPVVWGLLGLRAIASPVRRLDVGGPQRDAEQAVVELQQRGITAVRGEYWTVYVLDYYAKGRLDSWPDVVPRLPDDVARAQATLRPRTSPRSTTRALGRERRRHPPAAQGRLLAPPGRRLGALSPRP